MTYVVRTSTEPGAQTQAIEDAIRSVDRSVTISEVESMRDVVSEADVMATPSLS